MRTKSNRFWTEDDEMAITSATSFTQLSAVALRVLRRMPQPIGQVCGPISTGGTGDMEKNLAIFAATIQRLAAQGLTVFDQMPFEQHFFRIVREGWATRHNNQLLEEFYRPIFAANLVQTLYFIPGWESSAGARWEHELGQQLGMHIVYLSSAPVQF